MRVEGGDIGSKAGERVRIEGAGVNVEGRPIQTSNADARREGLSPIAWSALAFAIGPLAWVAMASRARPEGGTGGVVLGGLAIGMGVLIDAIVFGFVRIVPA